MLKKLATSALASLAVISAGVAFAPEASARPSTCWQGTAETLTPYGCDVRKMSDNQGTWWSINNNEYMIRLYNDGTAQIWFDGGNDADGSNWFTWEFDAEGDVWVYGTNNYKFIFRR